MFDLPERITPESLQKILTKSNEHVWVDLNWSHKPVT